MASNKTDNINKHAHEIYSLLYRIYGADATKNNGMFNGEAILCRQYAAEAEDLIRQIDSNDLIG